MSSLISANATGNGRRAFAAICHDEASTDSSPRFDTITRPRTDTMSPKSTSDFHAANKSGPTSANDSIA